ncbi:LCP family protein [Streptomyces kunmingensis]|uniref:LCP family protein n=1 Tax=Streptomyces kunmingensis TaxID=68225 RepID=A0ABU6CHL7_9ACTN|nr:LCP family protein [Streptomyces kunmingensis]MEB3963870.1 LCP family protein [Streptomyces kunmingensis]
MGRSGVRGERTRMDGLGEPAVHAGESVQDEGLHEDVPAGDGTELPDRTPRAGRHGGGRPKRRRHRILRWTAGVLAVLVVGTAGAGYLYYRHLNGNIKKDKLNLGESNVAKPTPNEAGQTPLNILLIGSDSRNTKENLKLGGHKQSVGAPPLADVQMLLHVSADRSNMSVISMPRDTMLKIPKCTDPDGKVYPSTTSLLMTNESLGRGGPGCTVATWQELTGIHIDHFMKIEFSGVVSMADAIGGVPVCVKQNVYSHTSKGAGSGLRLKKGTTAIKGEDALRWLRTRYGFEDGTDLGRTHAQHMYMNSMVRELRKNATLTNPNQLRKLAEQATKSLMVDEDIASVTKLYDLAKQLQKVPTKRITMTTMPTVQWSQNINRVVPKPDDADQLFTMVRDDEPLDGKASKKKPDLTSKDPTAADGAIPVIVRNGTAVDGQAPTSRRATAVVTALQGKGFAQAKVDPQNQPEEKTVISYPSADLEGDAQSVAKAIGLPLTAVRKSTESSGVTLVVGADWRSGGTFPKSTATSDGGAPKSSRPLNGDDTDACMDIQEGYTW